MTCHMFTLNVHDLTAEQHGRLIDLLTALGTYVDPRALVAWEDCDDPCLHCRPAPDRRVEDRLRDLVLGGFIREHAVGGVLDINAGEGP